MHGRHYQPYVFAILEWAIRWLISIISGVEKHQSSRTTNFNSTIPFFPSHPWVNAKIGFFLKWVDPRFKFHALGSHDRADHLK